MITVEHKQELDAVLARAVENDHLFTEWENDFIADWAEKMKNEHLKINISSKQQYVLDRIEDKLRKAGEL